jgi:hypothetical protein
MSMEIAAGSPPDHAAIEPRSYRSRVTNHRTLLPHLDGRSAGARRFRDLVRAFVVDMGGIEQCSEIKLGLLRRLAAMTVQAEALEAKMVDGEEVDIATLCQLASTAMRISSRLGIERVPRPIEPSLADAIRQNWSNGDA